MEGKTYTSFHVGDITVTIETEGDEVVGATAYGANNEAYEIGFALGHVPLNGGCEICRWINGKKVCWQVECRILQPPPDDEAGC